MNDLWLGRKIRALRKNKGITQDDLAKALGITPQAVSKWERGLALPELPLIPMLADRLECTIDALLREESDEEETVSAPTSETSPAAEDPEAMQAYHLQSLCKACLGEGETEFALGRYDRALLAYTKGVRGLEAFLLLGEEGADAYPWAEMMSIHWNLYLHRAVCYQHLMRQEDFQRDAEQARAIARLTESDEAAFAQALVQLGLSAEAI